MGALFIGSLIGGFAHPALVWGLGLASVPILIHLLNRQRHKPMQWAAMRFVLAAYRKTRRRVQLENLLLLLLRTAAIAFLALMVARPFTGADSPLASLTEGRRDLVLIVDGSASMGWRDGVDSVFDRAVKRARDVVHKMQGGRGDRVRLVFAGQYPRLLSWTSPDQALSMLDTLTAPTDEPLDLAAALGDVLHQARTDSGDSQVGGAGKLEVLVLSDLQARAFRPQETDEVEAKSQSTAPKSTAPKPVETAKVPADKAATEKKGKRAALFEVLDELQSMNVRVVVESLAGSDPVPQNLGIAAVEPLERFHGPGQVAEMGVEVANFGPTEKNGVRVVLEVDGERKPNQSIDVPARGHAQTVFPVVFKTSGEHVVTARLEEGDHLAVDNQRSRVVAVPPAVRVLLVDGAPGSVIEEDETGYLQAVIEPRDDDMSLSSAAPFEPRVIPADELSAPDLDYSQFDVIWLANVESVPAAVVDKLEAAVAAGRALVISLGDRVDASAWNARLFHADGTGLLPASIEEHVAVSSRAESYYRVKSFDVTHPALSFFADERFKPLLTEVPVYEFAAVRPIAGARVLATLSDDGAHPLLVERAYDRGKVFLWTSTIDPLWTRLPESPATLVPFVHELLRYAASQPEPPRNVSPGTPLAAETEQFPRNVVLVRPDGARRPLDGEATSLPGNRWKLPPVQSKDTEAAGVYRLEMEGGKPISFAVSVDPLEGDLERISAAELHALHPAFVANQELSEDGTSEPQRRGELWRPIAIAVLVILVLETMWAAWLGLKRSVRA